MAAWGICHVIGPVLDTTPRPRPTTSGPPSGTQLDVPARQWKRDRADEESSGDPEGEATRIDFGDPPLRVAEQSGNRIQLIDRTNHADSIAELEDGVVTGDTIVIASSKPRRHDAES